MIVRIAACVGLSVLAYFIGREIGRTESVREELRQAAQEDDSVPVEPKAESQLN